MYLLYVDESGDPGPRGSKYLLLGGAALFEGKWKSVADDIANLISLYFPATPRPNEVHFAHLQQGKGIYRKLSASDRLAMASDFCSIVTNLLSSEIALFSVVADKAWWFANNPGKDGDDLYAELFEHLSNRFDLFLRRRHAEGSPSKGIIIADPHKPALSDALKNKYKLFQKQGHRWGQMYNLIETVFFLPSEESPGLQIADLCAYGVWRLINSGDRSLAAQFASAVDREPQLSRINPGKWHGIRFLGTDVHVFNLINQVWA